MIDERTRAETDNLLKDLFVYFYNDNYGMPEDERAEWLTRIGKTDSLECDETYLQRAIARNLSPEELE